VVFHGLKASLCPTYPDWGCSVPVSDLDSLKQQRSFCREFRENGARMANVSSCPPGMPPPRGVHHLREHYDPKRTFLRIFPGVSMIYANAKTMCVAGDV